MYLPAIVYLINWEIWYPLLDSTPLYVIFRWHNVSIILLQCKNRYMMILKKLISRMEACNIQ